MFKLFKSIIRKVYFPKKCIGETVDIINTYNCTNASGRVNMLYFDYPDVGELEIMRNVTKHE